MSRNSFTFKPFFCPTSHCPDSLHSKILSCIWNENSIFDSSWDHVAKAIHVMLFKELSTVYSPLLFLLRRLLRGNSTAASSLACLTCLGALDNWNENEIKHQLILEQVCVNHLEIHLVIGASWRALCLLWGHSNFRANFLIGCASGGDMWIGLFSLKHPFRKFHFTLICRFPNWPLMCETTSYGFFLGGVWGASGNQALTSLHCLK